MLPVEVQSATRVYYKCWTDKYSSYVKTCDSVDILKAGLALQARSQGFLNAQMDMKRLQKANRVFERKATEAEVEAKS